MQEIIGVAVLGAAMVTQSEVHVRMVQAAIKSNTSGLRSRARVGMERQLNHVMVKSFISIITFFL